MATQTCTGDCLKCSFQQQTYCAAQRSYGLMKNQEAIVALIKDLDAKLVSFVGPAQINVLENNAQNGSGAENRESETI